jgi:hypothetical protein
MADKMTSLVQSPVFLGPKQKKELKRDSCLEFVMAKDNILTGKT